MRSAGSALVVVFFFLHYPDDRFLQTIGRFGEGPEELPAPGAPMPMPRT